MKYEKPVVHLTDTVSEGVYLASGAQETSGSQGGSQYRCKSKYMNGVYQKPTFISNGDGYKIVRGCEGCPAQDGESCRFVSHPEQMNWDGDFRPTWEQQGHGPDERAV